MVASDEVLLLIRKKLESEPARTPSTAIPVIMIMTPAQRPARVDRGDYCQLIRPAG